MKIEIIPFGKVIKERFEEARKYKLVEKVGDIWRVTKKCKKCYEPISYIKYLQGKIEKEEVVKTRSVKSKREQSKVQEIKKESLQKEIAIRELWNI